MKLLPLLLLTLFHYLHAGSFQLLDDDDNSDVTVPKLPRLSQEKKWEMIRESGQDPTSRRRPNKGTRAGRARRTLDEDAPWRLTRPRQPQAAALPVRPTGPPRAHSGITVCPPRFDAVIQGSNGHTYLFAGETVYQSWIEHGLPQKASFPISEMFAGGPRSVTAASTNSRSGVTTLFLHRTSYRFRWNEESKRFHIAKNSPKYMATNITLTPSSAMEWQGHQVLIKGNKFITYDAYWNLATFTSETSTYFPGIPFDFIGVLIDRGPTVLFFTRRNTVQMYDRNKHKVAAEFPVNIADYAGCMTAEEKKQRETEERRRRIKERIAQRGY